MKLIIDGRTFEMVVVNPLLKDILKDINDIDEPALYALKPIEPKEVWLMENDIVHKPAPSTPKTASTLPWQANPENVPNLITYKQPVAKEPKWEINNLRENGLGRDGLEIVLDDLTEPQATAIKNAVESLLEYITKEGVKVGLIGELTDAIHAARQALKIKEQDE